MRTFRIGALACLTLTASLACGGRGGTAGGGGWGGAGGSGGTGGVSLPASCDAVHCVQTDGECVQYASTRSADYATFHTECGKGSWGEGPCPTDGFGGGCKFETSSRSICSILWSQATANQDVARTACLRTGETSWVVR